ncbi:MAG: GNAT family N-acetyltransferase [Bradymonadaceae bacterium]
MTIHIEELQVRELPIEKVLPLRTGVLRPHFQPGRLAHFLEDDLPITRHFGVVDGDEKVLAVATFYKYESPVFAGEPAIKLRGMAVDTDYQGHGLGTILLDASIPRLALIFSECRTLWCNARIEAVPFYERAGFKKWGEEFEIKDIGTHIVMWRPMPIVLAEQFV